MSHPHRRIARALRVIAPVAIVLAMATPTPAHAQLGHLLKKAKKAVASSDDASHPPEFDDVTVELVPDRVAGIITGFQADARVLAGTNGNSAEVLGARRDAAEKAFQTSRNTHSGEFDQYDKIRMKNEDCRESTATRLTDQHEKDAEAAGGSDDAAQDMAAKYSKEIQAALQAGDMKKVQAIQKEMMKMVGNQMAAGNSTNQADSIAVETQCGPAPTPPGFIAEQDSLQALQEKLDAQVRSMQQRAQITAAQASGLNQVQFGMAIERIQYYFRGSRWAFSKTELAALDAHKTELKQAMTALELI